MDNINSQVTTSYNPDLFEIIVPTTRRLRNTLTVIKPSKCGGRIIFPALMKEFSQTHKSVDVRINKPGNIIMITEHTTNDRSFAIKKNGNIFCINSIETLEYLESKNIKIPAKYSIEWNEPSNAWVGKLIK